MLTNEQIKFAKDFLHPLKQRFFFWKKLPMALLGKVRQVVLTEEKSVAVVPFNRRNKNPFKSMYFAVQSMAAELSTAAAALLAMRKFSYPIALIIVKTEAHFYKKAKSKLTFICTDYSEYINGLETLTQPGDTVQVTAKAVGCDEDGNEVATFYFTWAFKRKA
jgi:hypothetical protein